MRRGMAVACVAALALVAACDPEVAILGVNTIKKRPVEYKGEIVLRDMMYLGLSFDHRVNDGAEAVQFLNVVIGYLQDPESLLLEM